MILSGMFPRASVLQRKTRAVERTTLDCYTPPNSTRQMMRYYEEIIRNSLTSSPLSSPLKIHDNFCKKDSAFYPTVHWPVIMQAHLSYVSMLNTMYTMDHKKVT